MKSYYVKESSYYDQRTATFHTKVVALCPIMSRADDFSDNEAKYPLFWVKYSDLEPYLGRQTMAASSMNNAAVIGADDYFTLTKYEGKIYKTNNLLGRTLAQYCPSDSAMAKEQKRIEDELLKFSKNIYGDQARKDSLDSIAKIDPKLAKKAARKAKTSRRSSTSSVKTKSSSSAKSSSSGSSAARVSVRRQRH